MEKLYTVSKNKTGAGCGTVYELLTAKFILKFKKVGTTTRIPYDYTVEVTKQIQGIRSDRQECVKNYGCRLMILYSRQLSRPPPRKGNDKRKNACLRRPYK